MPKRCALGCPPSEVHIASHRFPHPKRCPETLKAWVAVVGGKLETPEDFEYYRKKIICDIHFSKSDKCRNNRLNYLAVPTLHLPNQVVQENLEKSFSSSSDSNQLLEEPSTSCADVFTAEIPAASSLRIIKPDNFLPAFSTKLEEKENIAQCSSQNNNYVSKCDGATSNNNTQGILPSDSIRTTVPIENDPLSLSPKGSVAEHNYCSKPNPTMKSMRLKDPLWYMLKMREQAKQIKNLKIEILRLRKRSILYKTKLTEAKKIIKQSQKYIKQITKQDFDFEIKSFSISNKPRNTKRKSKCPTVKNKMNENCVVTPKVYSVVTPVTV